MAGSGGTSVHERHYAIHVGGGGGLICKYHMLDKDSYLRVHKPD